MKAGDKVRFKNEFSHSTITFPYMVPRTITHADLAAGYVGPTIRRVDIDTNKLYTIKEIDSEGDIKLEEVNEIVFHPDKLIHIMSKKKSEFNNELKKILID